jgi:hypothetical protein
MAKKTVKDHIQPNRSIGISKIFSSIAGLFRRYEGVSSSLTQATVAGSTYTGTPKASPQLFEAARYSERYSEREAMARIELVLKNNPILAAAVNKLVYGALQPGFSFTVVSAARGEQQKRRAEQVLNRLVKITDLQRFIPQAGYAHYTTGNSYIQPVINPDAKEIIAVVLMPSPSMERNTDERDVFVDTKAAYYQRDVYTDAIQAVFDEIQIIHSRYNCRPGRRYGQSDLLSSLLFAEQVVNALSTLLAERVASNSLRHFNITSEDGDPLDPAQFEQFKQDVSRYLKRDTLGQEINSPYEEIFTNHVELKILGGQRSQIAMNDIDYLIDTTLSATGVSRQILGWGTNVNRDILDEQIGELYNRQAQFAQDVATQILWPLFSRQLALSSIAPMDIKVEFRWNQAKPQAMVEKLLTNARLDVQANVLTRDEYRRLASNYYGLTLETETPVAPSTTAAEIEAPARKTMFNLVQPTGFNGSKSPTNLALTPALNNMQPVLPENFSISAK